MNNNRIPEDLKKKMFDETFGKTYDKPKTPEQQAMDRALELNKLVGQSMKPVLQTLKLNKSFDEPAIGELVARCFEDGFKTWSKDELITIVVATYTGMAMVDIRKYMEL